MGTKAAGQGRNLLCPGLAVLIFRLYILFLIFCLTKEPQKASFYPRVDMI